MTESFNAYTPSKSFGSNPTASVTLAINWMQYGVGALVGEDVGWVFDKDVEYIIIIMKIHMCHVENIMWCLDVK